MTYIDPNPIKSWQCHICKTVYAPTVKQCARCSKNEDTAPKPQLLTED